MIKDFLNRKKITQVRLQKITGIDQATISRICNGKQKPTLKQALLLEKHLNIPVSYWMEEQSKVAILQSESC